MMKFFCAIVGSVFPIDIDVGQSVGDLEKAIKAENPATITCDAKDLRLYLAKKGTGWLPSVDLAAIEDREAVPGFEKVSLVDTKREKSSTYLIQKVLEMNGMPSPQAEQIHVLVVVPTGASTPENNRKRKRMEEKDAPDAWIKTIKDERVTTLPSTREAMKDHLQRALHVKIPVSGRLFQLMSARNSTGEISSVLDKLFDSEPREAISDITGTVLREIIDPLGFGSESVSEQTYHHSWDAVIAMLLRLVTDGIFRRNLNVSASTGAYRPDLCFYSTNSNICVFRGQEKARGELDVPVKELHEKLRWRYDDAPYVFGYAAVGLLVCLVTIRKDEKKETCAKAEKIETYNLESLKDRLSFFLAMLNLSTLFKPVVDLIRPLGIPDYITLYRSNGVLIKFAEDCVVKTYPKSMPSDEIIRNLKGLHRVMKNHSVPNIVELKNANMKKKHVKLAPIGLLTPPENCKQLLMALRDILKALVALHAINLMHRDLRWENVIKYSIDGDKWFLIDFDDGTSSPAAKVTHLKAESHAPEIPSSSSTRSRLTFGVIKSQCLRKNPSSRPTAKSLLTAIESLIES
ncbi:putative fungal-type protein kinase [Plasmopara halstedii]